MLSHFKTFIIIYFDLSANIFQSSSLVRPIFAGSKASNIKTFNSLLNYNPKIYLPNIVLRPTLLKLYLLDPYLKHTILMGFIGKNAPFLNDNNAWLLVYAPSGGIISGLYVSGSLIYKSHLSLIFLIASPLLFEFSLLTQRHCI